MRVSSMVAAGDMKRCRSTCASALSSAAKPVQHSHVQTGIIILRSSMFTFFSGKNVQIVLYNNKYCYRESSAARTRRFVD